MLISSLENNHIKKIIKLKEKKYQSESEEYLAEGYHLVEEALKENLVTEIFVLEGISYTSQVLVTTVSLKVMKKLATTTSCPDIIALVKKRKEENIGNNVIILESIQDPGNLGTIIRTSKAFNVDTIILGGSSVDLYNSKVVRSAQGMICHSNILIRNDLPKIITSLKQKDYLVLGTKVQGGVDIRNVTFKGKIAIIIGNEGSGMSEEVSNLCDEHLYIKMHKDCESLNAAVAGAILMYEVFNK